MDHGEHQDFGHSSLLRQETDATPSSQKLLVVVTLAALVIAGSTFAYRTRSYPFSILGASDARQGSGSGHAEGKELANGYLEAPGEGSGNGEEGDDSRSPVDGNGVGKEKESKSTRKKDRRKRGKDPLKDILKGKSKGKALELLLESSATTSTASSSTTTKPNNKAAVDASATSSQKSLNGSTSGADADPEIPSQLADVSQKPRRAAGTSSFAQTSTTLSLSSSDRDFSSQRGTSSEIHHSGARTYGDSSPTPASSDTHSTVPASPFSDNEESSTASGADIDGDHNNARSTTKVDHALGASVGGLADDLAGMRSSSPTAHPLEIESESTGDTETSADVSMSSSINFNDASVAHVRGAEEAEITPVTSPASSEKSGPTPKVIRDAAKAISARSERKAPQPGKSQPLTDPWGWDGVSVGTPAPVASTSSSKADKLASTGSSRASLPGSPVTPAYTSFSSAVLSNKGKGLPPSTSSDLLSSTTESAPRMSASTSAPGVIPSSKSTPLSTSALSIPEERDHQGSLKEKEDEETAFTFPTLNPTTSAGAGPSRIRSTLGDIQSSSSSTGRASPSIGGKRRPLTPSRTNSHTHSRNPSTSGTPPPQRPMTPSSTSAPGSESPTPSHAKPALSVQTQLASMRGALEASRLREEKQKGEIEKYVKEIETMKWENANWRRAEIELQTQVRNLMHQLQAYTSVVAANAHLQQQFAAHGAASGLNNGSSPSPLYSTNPAQASSSATSTPQQPSTTSDQTTENASSTPSQTPQQAGASSSQSANPASTPQQPIPQPLNLHMLHLNGLASPSALLSPAGPMSPGFPLGPYPGAPPPFFPYAIPPHLQPASTQFAMAHAQHMHMLQQHQASLAQAQAQAAPSPHQASLFSMFSPPLQHATAAGHFGSTPSSAAGTSSVGSQSPDRSGSPTSGPSLSRRRSRPHMQRAGSRMGGLSSLEEDGDGWTGASSSQHVGQDGEGYTGAAEMSDDDAASEGEFNEVLADAIFKRPASIRVRSSSRSLRSAFEGEKGTRGGSAGTSPGAQLSEEPEQFTEFAFPSLTDMGNIIYQSSVKSSNGGAHSSGTSTSTSSSLSHSPAVPAPELTEETPAPNGTEEDRPPSLPPVVEHPEDVEAQALAQSPEAKNLRGSDSDSTPRAEYTPPSIGDHSSENPVANEQLEFQDTSNSTDQ